MLVGLDTAGIISETNNQDLPNLIYLETKWANKKKEKAERCQQRKICLAQPIAADSTLLSPDLYTYHPSSSFVLSGNNALLSFIIGGGFLSAVFSHLSFFVTSSGLLSAVLDCFSSLVIGDGLLLAISGHLLFLIIGDSLVSAILGRFLFFVIGSHILSTVFAGNPLSLLFSIGSRTLFLTNTLFYMHCFSLFFLPLFYSFLPSMLILLKCNPALLTKKRLFNHAFITQRSISSIQQQEKLDLSFRQGSYTAFIKINRL